MKKSHNNPLIWPQSSKWTHIALNVRSCLHVCDTGRTLYMYYHDYEVSLFSADFFLFHYFPHHSLGNIGFYAMIVRSLGKRKDLSIDGDQAGTKVRNQVARMLVVNGVVYFVLHLPVRII